MKPFILLTSRGGIALRINVNHIVEYYLQESNLFTRIGLSTDDWHIVKETPDEIDLLIQGKQAKTPYPKGIKPPLTMASTQK